MTFWERCGYNDAYPKKKNIREIEQIDKLYYDYHFNSDVKKNGDEMKHVKISKRYAKVVALVQKYMQK